jgi:D-threo-aldose 1-dehydrogenase
MTADSAVHPESVVLGRTGLLVGRLGLGCAPIGNLYSDVTEDDAAATIEAALQGGIRHFDVAPRYGDGVAERRLGHALSGVDRSRVVISTKVGYVLGVDGRVTPDFSADGVRRSLESSLQRLGLDRVDIVHVHDPDNHEESAYRSAFPALIALREQGVISAVGAGMISSAMLARFVDQVDLDCVLLAGRYTLLDQQALADLLPACQRHDVAVIVGGVYNSGLLADPRPGSPYDYHSAPAERLEQALAIQRVCQDHNVPLMAAALAFVFGHPAVTTAIVGARSPSEMVQNRALLDNDIPAELWIDLKTRGLLPAEVPTP